MRSSIRPSRDLETQFLGLLHLHSSLPPLHNVLGLDTVDATSPTSADLRVFVELLLEGISELVQLDLVFLSYSSEGNTGCSFLVHQLSQAALALDNAIRNILLAAKRRHPSHQLDRINIVGDHNKLGSFVFDQGRHMVQTILDHDGFFSFDLLSVLL